MSPKTVRWALLALATLALGCEPTRTTTTTTPSEGETQAASDKEQTASQKEKEQALAPGGLTKPPESGNPEDVSFPDIERNRVAQGLEVNTAEWEQLPVVYLRLVIKSGGETDPDDMPGLSHLVAKMLQEGTRKRTSAELAREVEHLGADLWTGSDEENVYIAMRTLRQHLDKAFEILADVTTNPAFRVGELKKLKKRELDRLSLQKNDPSFLAKRAFHHRLYGDHPYAHVDTTKEAVEKLRRRHLIRWHRKWVAPNNAFLVVAGDVTGERASELAEKEFKRWRQKKIPEREYPEPPERDQRRVVVVDRPQSVQSVIRIGNLAIARDHKDWIPLKVANQVLGGSAASRLFMDLREKRSLTYGAYSRVRSRVQVAPFRASASVRTEVTPRAVQAFFHHLDRITSEAPPEPELADAKRYLSDSFPLQIDTPGKIASMIADLRVYGLPDDYWNTYRSRIGEVSQDQSLKAAQEHIRPEQSLVVVVGRAASVVEPLRKWGPVTVVDTQGKVLEKFEKSSAEGDSKSETEDASGSKTSASQGEGG